MILARFPICRYLPTHTFYQYRDRSGMVSAPSPGRSRKKDSVRFGSLTCLLSIALVLGCGDTEPTSDGSGQKTCSTSGCCFSDDDCTDGEYCDGEGPCDSEGTCEPVSGIPCPPEIGPVCGCDGVTYQGSCAASSSGHRIDHDGVCEAGPCFSNDDCAEGEYCAGDGGCESEGTCTERTNTPCGLLLDPETGLAAEPMLCGCDGNVYMTECYVGNAGTRIDPTDECHQ